MLHWIHRHRRRAAAPRGAGAFGTISTSKPPSAETLAALAEVAQLAPANDDDRADPAPPRRWSSRR